MVTWEQNEPKTLRQLRCEYSAYVLVLYAMSRHIYEPNGREAIGYGKKPRASVIIRPQRTSWSAVTSTLRTGRRSRRKSPGGSKT
jgi:hypothetical protein